MMPSDVYSEGQFSFSKISLESLKSQKKCNRSRDYNARFTANHRTVSVYRVLQMQGVRVRRRTPVIIHFPP
ncbi:MAG: hypothetical protein J7K15_04425 [Deltaproteobacteria bacterium]|nr:hypothetical protein [Deltaproteobacteria bacterium]